MKLLSIGFHSREFLYLLANKSIREEALNKEGFGTDIVEYLNNPLKHGVFTQNFSFSIYSVESLVKKWQPKIQKEYPRGYTPIDTFNFKEFVDYEYWVDFETSIYNLNNIIRFINMQKRLEKQEHPIRKWSDVLVETSGHLFHKKEVKLEHFPDYASMLEINDAINISKIGREKKVFLTVTTVGKRGNLCFNEFVKSIPEIGEKIDFSEIRKRHLQRFVYRPYPPALFLWINVIGFHQVSEPERQFLNGAISYFRHAEWRTSIVLSAIAAEIILAELYEENFHKEAPDVSLGRLIELLKEKNTLEPEIENAITITNEKRIIAVHRSQITPSEREAIDSLFGAAKLALWYSSRF